MTTAARCAVHIGDGRRCGVRRMVVAADPEQEVTEQLTGGEE